MSDFKLEAGGTYKFRNGVQFTLDQSTNGPDFNFFDRENPLFYYSNDENGNLVYGDDSEEKHNFDIVERVS